MAKVIDLRIQTSADLKGITQIESALSKISVAARQGGSDTGASKIFKDAGQAAAQSERDILRYANALANVQRASGDAAGAVHTYSTALKSLTPNSIEALQATARLTQAQNALDGSARQASGGMAVLPRTLAGFSHEAAAAAKSMVGLFAILEAGKAVFNSFADAFQFKAQLDATRASIDAQLTGVRDLGQTYASAAAFGQQFKLTQQEQTEAIAASIGVMRSSKAPVEDILGVLARMQVLSPEQSLQEAAIALKALASGDTTSLVTRFEVSRDRANEMKAAIAGGADAVAVMSQFLNESGVNMDTLAAKTTGAAGAMKDLALANEELALAQAEFAQGPGLEIMRTRIEVTRDATRLLQGDVTGLNDIFRDLGPLSGWLGLMAEYNAMVFGAAQGTLEWAGVVQTATVVQDENTNAVQFGTAAMDAALASQGLLNVATDEAAIASGTAAAAKELEALQTQILAEQTQAAADAFLNLNPGIDEAGIRAKINAGLIPALTGELAILTMRIREAKAELGQATALSDQRAGERSGGSVRTLKEEIDQANSKARLNRQIGDAERRRAEEARREAAAQQQAEMNLARAKGDTAAQVNMLRQQQQGLNKSSAEYKNIEAQILGLEKQRAGGAKGRAGGGGGGSARASQAEQTATRLADIERQGGQKIAEINEQTQAKLAAIEKKYAEQRAAAQRALMDEIARSNAATAFAQQINDFDQFQKDLTDDQKAALQAREEAEAQYNAKVAQAQEEARTEAANGDAQLAEDILAARTEQAAKEKEIAEKAAEARRAGADEAAVAREAQEATDAARQAADTEIAIAQAKAQERAAAEQQEKDAVVAQAEEQKNKVVAAAEEQASKVKGASESQKSAVISSLNAQAAAAQSWANTIKDAANQAQSAMDGVTGPPAGEGEAGGEGAGDAGGGGGQGLAGARGLGRGASAAATSGDVIGAIQDVINFLNILLPTLAAQTKLMREALRYEAALKNTVGIIGQIIDLRKVLAQPVPPLDAGAILQIAKDGNTITQVLAQHIDVYAVRNQKLFQHLLAATKASIEILTTIQNLRGQLTANAMLPIDRALVQKLANEATAVVEIVKSQIITANRAQSKALEEWAKLVGNSVSIIKDVADLHEALTKVQPPIPPGSIKRLAELAAQTTRVVQAFLVPVTEAQAKVLADYASAAQGAIAVLKDVSELPEALTKIQPAIPPGSIKKLAVIARQVLLVVQANMVPTAEETAEQVSRYADAAGSAISLIKDTLGLTSDLFKDYKSPTNAQIGMVVKDADRLVKAVSAAAALYKTDGLEATKAYGDALGSVLGAFKDQLLFAQAIGSGDFVLDPKKLAQFEQGSKAIMTVAGRLAAQAATIPADNITALGAVTSALTGQAEMLIRMAAVPFGNLPQIAAGYGASGGGMGGSTVINVYGAQGQDVNALANIVMQRMNQQVGARR